MLNEFMKVQAAVAVAISPGVVVADAVKIFAFDKSGLRSRQSFGGSSLANILSLGCLAGSGWPRDRRPSA